MDYRHVALDELKNFVLEQPNISLGEILFSSLRNKFTGLDLKNLHQLTKLKDQDIYSSINKAKKDERELLDKEGNIIFVKKQDLT